MECDPAKGIPGARFRQDFNSRTHVECDLTNTCEVIALDISTHALTWSATILDLMWMSDREISTHALTWSATRCCARDTRDKSISTHALTWSATYTSIDGAKNSGYFNSRTHVECDKQNRFRHQKQRISTHALTWSATKMTLREKVAEVISTHALTWSATQLDVSRLAEQQFQLTHSRGVRHRYDQSYCTTQNFNSRTHVECDPFIKSLSSAAGISTHALTWSATPGPGTLLML